MDPNATLAAIFTARDRAAAADTIDGYSEATAELVAAFNDLDHWLSRGGLLPDRWEK